MCVQLQEIVYAKWDDTTFWYLSEVTQVNVQDKSYSLLYMDGYSKDNVPTREIRKVPAREKNNKMIGKRFFDEGDYQPGKRKTRGKFKAGEFSVLCYQPGKVPTYWCERLTNIVEEKREIVEFFCAYVSKRVDIYDNE